MPVVRCRLVPRAIFSRGRESESPAGKAHSPPEPGATAPLRHVRGPEFQIRWRSTLNWSATHRGGGGSGGSGSPSLCSDGHFPESTPGLQHEEEATSVLSLWTECVGHLSEAAAPDETGQLALSTEGWDVGGFGERNSHRSGNTMTNVGRRLPLLLAIELEKLCKYWVYPMHIMPNTFLSLLWAYLPVGDI